MTRLSILIACFASTVCSQTSDKEPFEVVSIRLDFGGFAPMHSSPNVPTQDCSVPGSILKPCAEKFSNTPTVGLGFGLRPMRYLEGDVSLNILSDFAHFGSFQNQYRCTSGCTGTVSRTIEPRSIFSMALGKGVLPLAQERLFLSAGAGIGWLQIYQSPQTMGNEQLQGCSGCQSRSAYGPTEIIEADYFPTSYLGFGVHAQSVQIRSMGLTPTTGISTYPSASYKDNFLLVEASMIIRFGSHQ